MPADTLPGRVGRFEIRRELGRGTMGVVFEAHDPTLHRNVALKVIRLAFAANAAERADFERRFLTEARAAAGLSHPGIVVVHEAGQEVESGMLYLALEHLEGRTLSELLAERGRLQEGEALRLAAQVARALDYAHRRGVVHRDVKPANVMVLSDGQAKILDFGLAKLEAGLDQTAAGQFLGTPHFVSPEQALGHSVDGRSDLFSLGAILYNLLAGRRPFEGESLHRVLSRVAHQPPRPLRELNPAVSPGLEAVVMRALAKEPADRHATGAALAEDLEDALVGRPPRHTAVPVGDRAHGGMAVPAEGEGRSDDEGTVVATRAGEVDEHTLPELALEAAPATSAGPASRGRKVRSFPLRAVSLTLLLGGLAFFYLAISGPERLGDALAPFLAKAGLPWDPWALLSPRSRPDPSRPVSRRSSAAKPVPRATPSTPAAEAAAGAEERAAEAPVAPADSPGAAAQDSEPESDVLSPGDTEDDAPVLLPDDDADAAPAPRPAAPKAEAGPSPSKPSSRSTTKPKSELAIHLEHPLSRGTVRVWLDDKLVLRQALSSTVDRKILFFNFTSGRVRETLEVPAGRHRLRVEVRGKDRKDAGEATRDFAPKARKRLYVRPGEKRGRLSFQWR